MRPCIGPVLQKHVPSETETTPAAYEPDPRCLSSTWAWWEEYWLFTRIRFTLNGTFGCQESFFCNAVAVKGSWCFVVCLLLGCCSLWYGIVTYRINLGLEFKFQGLFTSIAYKLNILLVIKQLSVFNREWNVDFDSYYTGMWRKRTASDCPAVFIHLVVVAAICSLFCPMKPKCLHFSSLPSSMTETTQKSRMYSKSPEKYRWKSTWRETENVNKGKTDVWWK